MKNMRLNAAVVALLFDDLSHRLMSNYDEICDLQMKDKNQYIDLLLVKYFGFGAEDEDIPLVRAMLTCLCEHDGMHWHHDNTQLEFDF